jgi:hypothetical protein
MRFLLKKNQLALILLTLVMMLTVYYIKSPFSKDDPGKNDDPAVVTGRLEQLSLKRLTLKNTRKDTLLELDAIIASNDSTVTEKSEAVLQKQKLNELTEKELLLELEIINRGYQDAFVHATTEVIDVTVVTDEHSVKIANQLILATLLEFDGISKNVRVSFQTVAEVMGTVSD